ncbi:uncharacterized protein LOC122056419 [Zingiber officinale]|uniref:uncharacterized protein LOC122056419 n=1 Tax=Zingiber officinale TaxID=94328 RepID=UPI001C4D1279|nr:uncharacterized protein LOC122056419 [Zingiber officinale]XP_042474292.1 uncharacterized protein LOC122056419 [Zingiber officinale]XP_042474293.1 uncharacterized protein LOC122056419 [Zingiber officinale]XP_042474294.1 uncharacterized protein LOC122056419 [Zingiber officinale]
MMLINLLIPILYLRILTRILMMVASGFFLSWSLFNALPIQLISTELKLMFPNAARMNRGSQVISEIIEFCRAHEYTDVIFVHEHRGEPDNLVICHLSFGPTTFFELLNVLCADLFCFIVNNYSLVKGLQTSLNISFLCLNLKLNE